MGERSVTFAVAVGARSALKREQQVGALRFQSVWLINVTTTVPLSPIGAPS